MTTDTTNVMTAIEEAITKGTFGLAAIESIKKLKDEHVILTAMKEKMTRESLADQETIRNTRSMYEDACRTITKLQEVISKFDKNQIDFLTQQLKAENAERRHQDTFNLVSMIFKSPTFVTKISESTQVPLVRDYNCNDRVETQFASADKTITKTQE